MLVLASLHPSPWLVLLRSLLVGMALLWFRRSYAELRVGWPTLLESVLAVAAGLAVFMAWVLLDHRWAFFGAPVPFDPRSAEGETDWTLALLRLAGFTLVVPIMEELFWRSFLLRWLERNDFLSVAPGSVGWRAFAITTALFAVEHNQWLAGAVAGAAYNVLYMRSSNLWVAILAHAVTNGVLGAWIIATGNWHFW